MARNFTIILTIVFFGLWWFLHQNPAIDLRIAEYYFRDGAFLGRKEPFRSLREVYYQGSKLLVYYVVFMMVLSFWRETVLPKLFYCMAAYLGIVGNLILVNWVFKPYFGRARPFQVEEFGGDLLFHAAPFERLHQCAQNCSFISGEASGAMILILLGVALVGGKIWGKILVWLLFLPMAWMRIMAGAHFFSDVVLSMILMAQIYWLFLWITGREPRDLRGSLRGFAADFIGLFRRKRGNSGEG